MPDRTVVQLSSVDLEISAVYLVWRDWKHRNADIGQVQRASRISLPFMSPPAPKRTWGFVVALVVGVIAIGMESYQLATQYSAC